MRTKVAEISSRSARNAGRTSCPPKPLSLPAFSPRSASVPVSARSPARRNCSGELTMGFKVAVVGATGNVGREMLEILAERAFPADEVVALASRRSQGVEVSYGERTLKGKGLE